MKATQRHRKTDGPFLMLSPMELGARLQPQVGPLDSEEAEYMRRVNFPSAVGTLMHIAVQTRPVRWSHLSKPPTGRKD